MAKVYEIFTSEDIISGQQEVVTATAWSDNSTTLSTFFTSSTQSGSSGEYYLDIYDKNISGDADTSADPTGVSQFSIAYGHIDGSGSKKTTGGRDGDSPTNAIFSQYSQLLLENDTTTWRTNDASGTERVVEHIYSINFNRARAKEALDPGNWELTLSSSNARPPITLIDDSGDNAGTTGIAGKNYYIISGTLGAAGNYNTTLKFGKFYPEQGMMIMDAGLISSHSLGGKDGVGTRSGSNKMDYPNEPAKLYNHIKAGAFFKARNAQTITSTYYFCRIKNRDFNFSNNPTFVTGSDGSLKHSAMKKNPQTYITTIGMYNNANELLAVAKLSKPLLKNFLREALVKVKLEY
jgi:hypothetical protein